MAFATFVLFYFRCADVPVSKITYSCKKINVATTIYLILFYCTLLHFMLRVRTALGNLPLSEHNERRFIVTFDAFDSFFPKVSVNEILLFLEVTCTSYQLCCVKHGLHTG